jgi:biopolymer transport protein ExbB
MDEISLVGLFQRGGVIMWPLFALSVLSIAVILDRVLFFVTLPKGSRKTLDEICVLLAGQKFQEAEELAARVSHPVLRVVHTYLRNRTRPEKLRLELIRQTGSRELERVERRLRILAVISHLAPLIGLLGTVIGMVIAFAQIEALQGSAGASDLAGGIWEALLTTVFGLIVAIPSMAAYHGFESLADRISRRMQAAVARLDDCLELASLPSDPSSPGSAAHPESVEEELVTVQ